MKSKNMTLMVVAIGCGLVAAFLTAKLSGGGGPEMVDVIVAKKELPVGTILEEKDIDSMVAMAKFPKATVPPDTMQNIEDLKGKRVNRTLKTGNFFAAGDVGNDDGIKLPEGMYKYAIKTDSVRSAGGFVQPGNKVDVLLTEQTQNGKAKSGVILVDMLVLAVDQAARPTEGSTTGRAQMQSVSLAVSHDQSLILSSAEKRGEVKLILRDPKNPDRKLTSAIEKIPYFDEDPKAQQPVAPVVKTVSIVVAKTEVPLNTFITNDNFSNFFITKDMPEEVVPARAVKDPVTLRGKYITSKMEADQIVFGNWLSDDKVVVKTDAPAKQSDVPAVGEKEVLPSPRVIAEEKPEYPRKFLQIINNQSIWFLEVGPGEFRRVEGNAAELKDLPQSGSQDKKAEKKVEEARSDRAA